MNTLIDNLRCRPVSLSPLSQYLPEQAQAVNAGKLDKIRSVLLIYAPACQPEVQGAFV
ncbi:hypothetical protein [Xenorhabdus beddingii]|uniref:hypothetical protein n=1 Tax=Xenorhabdus beddingii TaxID=40578 RepID=UPI003BB7D5F9